MKRMPIVLSVAGFDPVSGAGATSDIKTIEALGGYGVAVVTCIAIQNTLGVTKIIPVDPSDVALQIDTVTSDVAVDAIKIGTLPNEAIVDIVAEKVAKLGAPIVLDPVIAPTKGPSFLDRVGVEALRERLVPLSTVVTPNVWEARELTGIDIRSESDLVRAARALVEELGAKAALVKGFKEGSYVKDALYVDNGSTRVFSRRDLGIDVHGLGCVLSSAIATLLATGLPVADAVARGIDFAIEAATTALRIGRGRRCPNHLARLRRSSSVLESMRRVREAVETIERLGEELRDLVPEVGMNIVEAPPHPLARGVEDCVGVEGRISKCRGAVKACGCVWLGASSHVARAVLEAQRLDPSVRACINIRPFPGIDRAARELGLTAVFIDRREEPPEVRAREGASIPWIVRRAYEACGRVPDIVYDSGDVGKEPMARVFGRDVIDALTKVLSLARAYKRYQRR